MENATKALLIAAAVLIAIVLIALGVRLLSSASDSSSQAGNVSNQLNQAMETKITDIQTHLTDLP